MASKQLRTAAKLQYYRLDYPTFCKEQLVIKPDSGELVHFELDSAQMLLDRKIEDQFRTQGYARAVTLKGRQSGWSTYAQSRLFHRASLTPNYNTLLIAYDEPGTQGIFEMAHLFWEMMAADIRPLIRRSNKRELFFANPDKYAVGNAGLRSKMDFQHSGNVMAGTSTTRQALHCSEISKWDDNNVDFLFASLLPTIHYRPGTLVIAESTAFATGDKFREMCEKARSGKSSWAWCFAPWWTCNRNVIPLLPGEQLKLNSEEKYLLKLAAKGQPTDEVPPWEITQEQFKWRRERLKDLGDLVDQEYPSTFEGAWLSLDSNVFDKRQMDEARRDLTNPLRFVSIDPGPTVATIAEGRMPARDEEYIAVWENPVPGVIYDIGVDPGHGFKDGDWTVAEVFRRDTGEQVAEYHKHVDPVEFGDWLYWFGKWYNNAQLIIEMNGVGYITHNRLSGHSYPYLYIWRHRERNVPTLSTFSGFKTTWESKRLLVGYTKNLFQNHKIKIRSYVLWNEMLHYVRVDEDRYRGEAGYHDDAVMGLMLAVIGGVDESFGVPKAPVREERERTIYNPALRDNTDFGTRKDRIADAIIKDLRGVA